jgi:hypothetical protein
MVGFPAQQLTEVINPLRTGGSESSRRGSESTEVTVCAVALSGTVDSRDARRAEDIAEQVSGVKHVQNNLWVQQQTAGTTGTSAGTAGTKAANRGPPAKPTIRRRLVGDRRLPGLLSGGIVSCDCRREADRAGNFRSCCATLKIHPVSVSSQPAAVVQPQSTLTGRGSSACLAIPCFR